MVQEDQVKVELIMPEENLFVGSYHRIIIRFAADTTLKFDDLHFEIPDGLKGGSISPSKDELFDEVPNVMLLVGYQPGMYALNVIENLTGIVVGSSKFTVDALWLKDDAGPTRWISNITTNNTYSTSLADGTRTRHQNFQTVKETRRIAILLVDTKSQRFDPTTLDGHKKRWMNAIVDGTVVGEVTKSSRLYFQEVSYNKFDLSANIFGPVHLPGNFDEYFNADNTAKGTFFQACFTAGDSQIDFENFDTLLCISQHVEGTTPRRAWANATRGNWNFITSAGTIKRGAISMPNESDPTDPRTLWDTFSHELGHNLDLRDQYKPDVVNRNLNSWDIMAYNYQLPHFSLANRLSLGWVPSGWVKSYELRSSATPVDQTVTLHPVELGNPPAGRFIGIEIRVAANWNYYFEYRVGQPKQIGDRYLPVDNVVLGTDVIPSTTDIRPSILLLDKENNGDGPVLINKQSYKEVDSTDPTFPTNFTASVSGIDGKKRTCVSIFS